MLSIEVQGPVVARKPMKEKLVEPYCDEMGIAFVSDRSQFLFRLACFRLEMTNT